ncbi:GGDEF domain-containing protein [Acinetobacter puyangensis]|uniref:diguanylate cyclase n=1 Tax=Acinetobacter puyangensis TaxID=1096779 RepID=A0A240ECF8_9GAMM|nr:GGDEF domain-containing protein [Acinetobacter puyangensis]SNX46398.1 diguanylate cyclase (GGDEF) domain-containing protein [Acinetobacter puyangensis]
MLLNSAANDFVLLVPICLIFIGVFSIILWLQHRQIHSLFWLAIGAVSAGAGLLGQSLIPAEALFKWAFWLAFIYLTTFIALAQAIALRFHTQISWSFCFVILVLNQIGIFYYSFIDEQISVRYAINGLSIFLIFSHILPAIYRAKMRHQFDQWLKRCAVLMMACLFFREVLLIYLVFNVNPTFNYSQSYIGFLTQFIGLFFQLLFAALLIGTGIQDTLIALDKERNFDDLTGILNRRSFFEKASHYLPVDSKHSNVLFMCDIDYFKQVNDQYGHAAGDQVLKFFADKVSSLLRSNDLFARIGGEEFVCILCDVSLPQALEIIENIRHILSTNVVSPEIPVLVTASFGAVQLDQYNVLEDALKHADQLMYQAKLAGRDNIQHRLIK